MTTQTKHTPGPWSAFIWNKNAPHIITIGIPYSDGDAHLCKIDCSIKTDENKANARLIAAAPDLLRACKMALETIKHAALEEFNIPQDYLERAIAKAEGGQS